MSTAINQALELAKHIKKLKLENKLDSWKPIPKHWEFLNSKNTKKGIIAGNRVGKTKSTMYELTCHLTGKYPQGWQGRKFNRPIKAWVVSMAYASIKDTLQADLFGPMGELGTGFIPKDCIVQELITMKSGMSGVIESARVRSAFGGNSFVKIWSGLQDRKDFQGAEIDVLVFDEEPKSDVHSECLMRLATSMAKNEALAMYSFTPLEGVTDLYKNLRNDPDVHIVSISMDDVPWLDKKTIESLLFGLPPHLANAKRHGIASVGTGQIFQFDPSEYSCESFEIPSHWPRMGGLDIGYNHPTGAVAIAWDRDSGTLYVYQEYKVKEKSAVEVARNLRSWGVQFATSHDAFNNTFQQGSSVADVFKDEGLHCFSAGREPWARIEKTRSLMSDGKMFIFSDRCPELMKEMQTYHSKTSESDHGKIRIHKVDEDVIDAFTHAVMFYEEAQLKGVLGKPTPNFVIKQWEPSNKKYGV